MTDDQHPDNLEVEKKDTWQWRILAVVLLCLIIAFGCDMRFRIHVASNTEPKEDGAWYQSWAEAQKHLPFFATPNFWEEDPDESWNPEEIHGWGPILRIGFWRPKKTIFGIRAFLNDHGTYSAGTNFWISNNMVLHTNIIWGIQIYNPPITINSTE